MKDTEAVGQTDREDHLKLGKFLKTAEDDVNTTERQRKDIMLVMARNFTHII